MAWKQHGIIEQINGTVKIGYDCCQCGDYWQMSLPQDDYSTERLKNEKCYSCTLRDHLAKEMWGKRQMKRMAMRFIKNLEAEVELLKEQSSGLNALLTSGSNIIIKQDEVIRDLKKKVDKKKRKR